MMREPLRKKLTYGVVGSGILMVFSILAVAETDEKAAQEESLGTNSYPIVVQIDFERSYSGRKGQVFSHKDKVYQVTCEEIEISARRKDEVFWQDKRMEGDIRDVIDSGGLKECHIEEIAIRIKPVEYKGKKVVFVIRREQGRYGLYDKEGCVVADHLKGKVLRERGIPFEGLKEGD